MNLFLLLISFVAFVISTVCFIDCMKRSRFRYIVHKSFLKMEDRTKKDLTKWKGNIEVTHNYYDGPLFVQK